MMYHPIDEMTSLEINPVTSDILTQVPTNPERTKAALLARWRTRFAALSDDERATWLFYFGDFGNDGRGEPLSADVLSGAESSDDEDDDEVLTGKKQRLFAGVYLQPIEPGSQSYITVPDGITEIALPDNSAEIIASDTWRGFLRFSESIRRAYRAVDDVNVDILIDPPARVPLQPAIDFEEMADADTDTDIIDKLLPTGLSWWYGLPGSGKSALAHRAALAIAHQANLKLDGADTHHGRVFYLAIDRGGKDTAKRMKAIREHLKLDTTESGRLVVEVRPMDLSNAESVNSFIEFHRVTEPYKLLVIDSLHMAIGAEGSMLHLGPILINLAALHRARFAESILIVSHTEKKGLGLYGDIFQQAQAVGLVRFKALAHNTHSIEVERPEKSEPVTYKRHRLDGGPFLIPATKRKSAEPWEREQQETESTSFDINKLETGKRYLPADALKRYGLASKDSNRVNWRRQTKRWEKSGLVKIRKSGSGSTVERVKESVS
jgi:hypothetical protein